MRVCLLTHPHRFCCIGPVHGHLRLTQHRDNEPHLCRSVALGMQGEATAQQGMAQSGMKIYPLVERPTGAGRSYGWEIHLGQFGLAVATAAERHVEGAGGGFEGLVHGCEWLVNRALKVRKSTDLRKNFRYVKTQKNRYGHRAVGRYRYQDMFSFRRVRERLSLRTRGWCRK